MQLEEIPCALDNSVSFRDYKEYSRYLLYIALASTLTVSEMALHIIYWT